MKPPSLLLHRIEVQLKMRGIEYTFTRSKMDKFGQPIEGDEDESVIVGIYHESNSYIQMTGGDATVIRTRKSPMILCLFADGDKVKQGDRIVINEKTYKVSGVLDIQNYHVVADISLEEVLE